MPARAARAGQRSRAEAERARRYAARAAWHDRGIRRRRRDNIIAVTAGSLIVLSAFVSQTVHAQVTSPPPSPTSPAPSAPAVGPEPTSPTDEPAAPAPIPTPTQTPSE